MFSAILGFILMTQPLNLSHEQGDRSYETLKQKIEARGDLPHVTVKKQLELLGTLRSSQFGRFLIERGGLNGYWTHQLVTDPEMSRKHSNPLEAFLFEKAPTAKATQERFQIFKREIQKRIQKNCSLASIPCGVMGELLDLDYSAITQFELIGIDLDPESIDAAKNYATEKNLHKHAQFITADAWNLPSECQFDLIASNGLNIYVQDDAKAIELYRAFYKALKPEGTLITSFVTPPAEWRKEQTNPEDLLLQKILFVDILEAKWQVFRTTERMYEHLTEAGFHSIEFLYDRAHLFPTVIAQK